MDIRKMLSIFFVIIAMLYNICIPTQANIEHGNQFLENAIRTNTSAIAKQEKLINNTTNLISSNILNTYGQIESNCTKCVLDHYGTKLIQKYNSTNSGIFCFSKICCGMASCCITKSSQWVAFIAPFLICGGIVGICKYLLDKIHLRYLRSSILKYAEKSSKMEECRELNPISLAKRVIETGIRDDTNIMVCRLVYKLLFRRSLKDRTAWTMISKRPFDTIPNLVDYLEKLLSYTEVFDEYKFDDYQCNLSNLSIQKQNFINLVSNAKSSSEVLDLHLEMVRLMCFLEEFQENFDAKTKCSSTTEFISYSQSLRMLGRAIYEVKAVVPCDIAELITNLSLKIPETVDNSDRVLELISGVTTILEMVTDAELSPQFALGLLKRLLERPNENLSNIAIRR